MVRSILLVGSFRIDSTSDMWIFRFFDFWDLGDAVTHPLPSGPAGPSARRLNHLETPTIRLGPFGRFVPHPHSYPSGVCIQYKVYGAQYMLYVI